MARALLFLLLAAAGARAQFSFGVKGGIPATDAFEASAAYRQESKRYTVGPMVELGLPLRFGLEFDALYKRLGYSETAEIFGTRSYTSFRAASWEFPLILRYHLTGGLV